MRSRDDRCGPGPWVADVIAEGVRGAGPAEVPGRLCAVAVRLLPVDGAGVSLHGGGIPVPLSASSSRAAYAVALQATLGDGPCLYAARTGAPVLAPDLTGGPDAHRWPVFAQQAAMAGVRAVYAMPLGSDTVCVGTLDLCRDTPGDFTAGDLRTARLVAGATTLALLALLRAEGHDPPDEEFPLGSGLAPDHHEIHQAVGMVMAQLGITANEALSRLRAHAFTHDRTAMELAHEMVTHGMTLDGD